MSDQTDVLQGTLDLLIMRTIALQPMHGWAIAQRIQQISAELLRVQQGSLYPALHRLEHQGWIAPDGFSRRTARELSWQSLRDPRLEPPVRQEPSAPVGIGARGLIVASTG